jgi:acyl-CoA synthetase (AMP-forming)/AMP-acid ligase II
MTSVQARWLAQIEAGPARPAMGFMAASGPFTWLTREALDRRAALTAGWLAESGARRGAVCVIVLPSTEWCATVLLGALRLGAVPLLIAPPSLQGAHSTLPTVLTRTVARTRASVAVCAESLSGVEKDLGRARRGTALLFADGLPPGAVAAAGAPVTPAADDVALMQLTSGTTGMPRICVWQQRQVLAALDGMVAAMRLQADDRCFNWTPLYHDMGLVNNFLVCLARGIPLAMLEPHDFVRNPALWLQGLHRTGATVTWSPNFGFALAAQRASDADLAGVRLDGVHAFWNAAERIHLETMQRFQARFAPYGVREEALKTNFGCAENVGGATFSAPDGRFVVERIDREALFARGIARPVAEDDGRRTVTVVGVGRPAPGLALHILSRRGQPLPDGRVGEIALQTPSRMTAYLGQARETKRALAGGYLRTGDLGYRRGEEVFWVGRTRERIAVRGRKLDPSDFEGILLTVDGLRRGCFAAFGVDDPVRGTQRLVLVVESQEPATRSPRGLAEEIRERVVAELGVAVDDLLVVRSGTLTKTSSGKRRHRIFKERYLAGLLTEASLSGKETRGG